MTRHVHIEPVGGVAGDMFVAAMLDAFPESVDKCWHDLRQAGVLRHVDVKLAPGTSKGLAVQRFNVSQLVDKPARTGNYRDIRAWLEAGDLEQAVKQRALTILHSLAEAESHVHGVDIEQVHFHEVADWDSITDIVAAASVIERTGIHSWSCSALPLGSGLVSTEHGLLPVPAPATAYLLQGLDVWDDGESGERVTPTGAAIVRHVLTDNQGRLVTDSTKPSGGLSAVGSGAGQRDLQQRPNIVRCVVVDRRLPERDDSLESAFEPELNELTGEHCIDHVIDHVIEINFDIDDMTAEELAVSLEFIRAGAGVTDISHCMGVGKKSRSVFKVTVLCEPAFEQSVCELCFQETTTLGMRVQRIARRVLKRTLHSVADSLGTAQIKLARRSGYSTAKVESDDLSGLPGLQARRSRAQQLRNQFEQ